jgi:carbonic anhydrase/acetyltransferase-like protein (isoleucine patch superfamily)
MRNSVIGAFSYVQAGEISHLNVAPGTVWIRTPDVFNFLYRHPIDRLSKYIFFSAGGQPQGILMDFVEDRKQAFQRIFESVNIDPSVQVPASASFDRYAVRKPRTRIGENVLVAQRAYVQNSTLERGANAQENCYIINSNLQGFNVTAHGAKIIDADMGKRVFVGFNSFVQGRPDSRITIGDDCAVMPHTIIDSREPLTIPSGHLVWGLINNAEDVKMNSLPLEALSKVDGHIIKGNMVFEGNGARFVNGFQDRIQHILEANGAFFDGATNKGHAQRNQNISFNTIQPYSEGDMEGLYPTIRIES